MQSPSGRVAEGARCLVAALLCVASLACLASDRTGPLPLGELGLRVWRDGDGLPHPLVRQAVQDSHGYLWLATHGGLARFDGIRWSVRDVASDPGLASNAVGALAIDRAGALWIGTRDGLSVLRHGKIDRVDRGLPGGSITALLHDRDGDLWVAVYEKGVFRRRGDGFTRALAPADLPSGSVLSLLKDRQGALWIGTTLGGVARWTPEATTTFDTRAGLPHLQVAGLAMDAAGRVLVATDGGLAGFDGLRFQPIDIDPEVSAGGYRTIMVDASGSIWLGSSRGLVRVANGKAEILTQAESLSNDVVYAIYEDREGNVWVGTRDGLNQLSVPTVRYARVRSDSPEPEIGAVCRDGEGVMWVSTNGAGLFADRGAGFFRIGETSTNGPLHCLPDGGVLFVGASGIVHRFAADGRSSALPGATLPQTPSARALAMIFGADGSLWVGTNGAGVWVLRDRTWTTLTKDDGLPDNVVTALAEGEDGRLWVGTQAGAAVVVDGRVLQGGLSSPLASMPFIWTFQQGRNGEVWTGGAGGLVRTRNDVQLAVTAREGLGTDVVFHIALDRKRGIWLAGDRGVIHIPAHALEQFAASDRRSIATVRLGRGDGVRGPASGMYQPRGWTDEDGQFWFVTTRGLATFNFDRTQRQLPHLDPRIERVHVGARGAETPDGDTILVPASAERLTFDVSAPRLTAPERVRIQYRLEGFDEAWGDLPHHQASVSYTRLPPGEYRMVVRASDDGLTWHTGSRPALVEVDARLYQKPWFIALLGAMVAALVGLALRARIARIEARHEAVMGERLRLARELHDTLLQGFSGILMQLQTIARTWPEGSANDASAIESLVSRSRRNLVEARDAVWDLRHIATESFPQRLRRIVEDVQEGSRQRVTLKVDRSLRLDDRHVEATLLRIVEEALRNALRHSNAGSIVVSASRTSGRLVLSVEDDGDGFEVKRERAGLGAHWGVLGMRERASSIGARFELESAPGKGTKLMIEVPQ